MHDYVHYVIIKCMNCDGDKARLYGEELRPHGEELGPHREELGPGGT